MTLKGAWYWPNNDKYVFCNIEKKASKNKWTLKKVARRSNSRKMGDELNTQMETANLRENSPEGR